MHKMTFNQNASVSLGKTRDDQRLPLRGKFRVEHWRAGELLKVHEFPNGIVNQGKNSLFDVYFHAQTQITAWYIGLIDNSGYTALASDDIYDDIDQAGNGWDEFKLYTDAGNSDSTTTRPAWPEDAASAQAITNSSQVIFDVTGSGTVKGLFVCGGGANSNIKGDHASDATLWATALFDQGDTAVVASDQLKITYTVSA